MGGGARECSHPGVKQDSPACMMDRVSVSSHSIVRSFYVEVISPIIMFIQIERIEVNVSIKNTFLSNHCKSVSRCPNSV